MSCKNGLINKRTNFAQYMTDDSHDIILFDGVCNLCNGAVQFVIRHNKNKDYRFASLQSDFADNIFKKFGEPVSNKYQSIVLLRQNRLYKESSAALRIAQKLNGGWKLLSIFLIVPKFIRDFVYRFIAKRRYKWFGKRDVCMIPSPELKERFLDV